MEKEIIKNNLQPNKNIQITKTTTKERRKIMQLMIFIMKDSKNNSVDIKNLTIKYKFCLYRVFLGYIVQTNMYIFKCC